jgi:RNA polymerase sigma-70 factor (ECF subfamily)
MATDLALARWLPWAAPATEADWEALYVEQMPKVYNYFRYRFGEGPDAEDLTSRTFERAWSARGRDRRDLAGFAPWLLAIARNVGIDHLRARRHRDAAPLEDAEHVAAGPTPEDEAVRRSDADRLGALLALLPDRERELMALKYGAGLTNRAIARVIGMTETNVGTLAHRTVQRLRVAWNEGEAT